ncbi:MAG: SAF domain-containing protein [Anaerolineales bacterium]
MSRRARIGIILAIAGLIVAVIGIISVREIMTRTFSPPPAPTVPPPVTESVVVTTHDIELGEVLLEQDVTLMDMPIEVIPRNALNNVDAAIGKFSKVNLVEGELVLQHHLADPTNVSHDIAYTIGDNQVLMAFPAGDLMSGLAVLQRGDLIDILVTMQQEVVVQEAVEGEEGEETEPVVTEGEEETQSTSITFDANQAIEISAIVADIQYEESGGGAPSVEIGGGEEPQPTPRPQPSQVRVRAYLFALDLQDALVLKHLIDTGAKFDLVLRAPTSDQIFDLTPVSSDYIVERYQLEIIR